MNLTEHARRVRTEFEALSEMVRYVYDHAVIYDDADPEATEEVADLVGRLRTVDLARARGPLGYALGQLSRPDEQPWWRTRVILDQARDAVQVVGETLAIIAGHRATAPEVAAVLAGDDPARRVLDALGETVDAGPDE